MASKANDTSKIHAAYANQMGRDLEGSKVPEVTEAQLAAAFLAARQLGKILDDDVLRAIIIAARNNDK